MKNTSIAQTVSIYFLVFGLVGCVTQSKPGSSPATGGSASSYSGVGAESVSPEVLAKYAPSALPKELAGRVRNLLEVQSPGLGALSVDGKTMYFTWTVSGVNQIWKIDGPLRFPEQLTSGEDPTLINEITADGKYLIVSRDRAGEENPGLYLMPTAGGEMIEIFHKKNVRTSFAFLTTDNETIFYTANDIKAESFALYGYSMSTRKRELLMSEPGVWYVADAIGTDKLLLGKATGALTAEFWSFDIATKTMKPMIGQGEKEEFDATFGMNPNELFVLTSKFGEFKRLYRYKDGKFDPITPDVKMDVETFSVVFNRFRMYIQYNDGGYMRLEVRNPDTFNVFKMPEFKDADHVVAGKASRMGRYVTLGVETGTRPRVSYVFDWSDQRYTQWVRPSIPEADPSKFVTSVLEYYTAKDGTKIPMLVTRPKQCAKSACPVVVSFHGGPEGQSRPGFNKTAQLFAMEGMIYVQPNVRGSDGYGKAWFHADDGAKRLNVISDIEDAAVYIKKNWVAKGKAKKIGVMGGSYGGYAALMAMTKFAGSYDAGVSIVGMSDLRTFLANTASYRRILRTSEYGDLEKDADALRDLSPITYLDRIEDPLMIIQGANDPRVPVGEAIQFKNALDKKGVSAPLIIFADEGHGSAKRENKVLELGHALQFFKTHLGK